VPLPVSGGKAKAPINYADSRVAAAPAQANSARPPEVPQAAGAAKAYALEA